MLSKVWFCLKKKSRKNIIHVVKHLTFNMHVTIKWNKVSDDPNMCASYLLVKCAWKKKRLARNVRSSISSMFLIICQELLQGPSAGTSTITFRCRATFATALAPQPQLWHIKRLVFASPQTTCDHKHRACCTSYLKETLLQSSKRISVWMTSTSVRQRLPPCLSTSPTITGTEG